VIRSSAVAAAGSRRLVPGDRIRSRGGDRCAIAMATKQLIEGVDPQDERLASEHAFDALVAAYTGWLAPEGLEEPPEGFNVAAGWIWFPAAANENEPAPIGDSASVA
jgi:hypothetical protein